MDEKALNELLECSVCLDRLDASSKVLPCQHTFCRWCLEEIISTKKELRCPECRCLVEAKITDLPTNILLMRLLEGMKNAARSSGSSTKSSPSHFSDKTGSGPTSPTHCSAEGGPHSPQHKVIDVSSQPCAKALYSYDATEPGDLSFKKSDIIMLRKQVDENWYHGEINGKHGFFPATYVQIVTPMTSKEVPTCKALFDFTDQNEKDCLTFQKDVTMTVIRRVDDNWVEGKLGDNIGIFPKAFVELNDAAKMLINFQACLVKANQSQTNDLNNHTRSNPIPTHPNLSVSLPLSVASTMVAPPATTSSTLQGATPSPSNTSGNTHQVASSSSIPTPQVAAAAASHQVAAAASSASHQVAAAKSNASPQVAAAASSISHQVATGSSGASTHLGKPSNLSISHKSSNKRHSLHTLSPSRSTPPQSNRRSMELSNTVDLIDLSGTTTTTGITTTTSSAVQVTPTSPRTISSQGTSPEGHTSPKSPISIYVALYTYKPHKEDEMDLVKGDFYSVTEKCQDGWYKGVCLRTGTSGVFPGNYVQPVKMTPSKSSGIGVSRSPSCVSASSSHNTSVTTNVTSSSQAAALSSSQNSSQGTSSSNNVNHNSMSHSVHNGCVGAALSTTAHLSQVSVTRTHSFPKTSPVTLMDYGALLRNKARLMGTQGLSRATISSSHPRPITNITQAQIRSAQTAAGLSVAQSRSHSMLIPSTVMSTSASHTHHQGAASSEQDDESKTQSLPTGITAQQAYQNSQVALRALSPSTGNRHSPRSSRRHTHGDKCSKHSANQSKASARHSYIGSSGQPPMSANIDVTPPNVVIGATGGVSEPVRDRDKEKKKDKERLPVSLMKKLTAGIPMRVRKSKSPNPDSTGNSASCQASELQPQCQSSHSVSASGAHKSSTHSPNHHHRSGSAPIEAGTSRAAAAAASPNHVSSSHASPAHASSHRKSHSMDSNHSNIKPAKVKPLVRERYRCLVPYPPQSDMELELRPGDVVYVHKKRDDGWYKGTLQNSGKTGLFPGSFVEKC